MPIDDLLRTNDDNKDESKKLIISKKEGSNQIIKKKKKEYFRAYLEKDAIELIYDIVYTEKDTGNFSYTIGDAIFDGLKELAKNRKLKNAPSSFKKK